MGRHYCFYCELFKKEKVEAEYVVESKTWRNLKDDSVILVPPHRVRYCCGDCMNEMLKKD